MNVGFVSEFNEFENCDVVYMYITDERVQTRWNRNRGNVSVYIYCKAKEECGQEAAWNTFTRTIKGARDVSISHHFSTYTLALYTYL